MSTAGQDFFDKKWFKHHTVFLFDCPIEKLNWYVDIRDDLIDEWAKQTKSTEKDLARCTTTDFSAKILPLPLGTDNQVLHHFEKVVWLIQSYCANGWKNSVKAVNHLDNGRYTVHPGTNRCIAAKYLGCKTLPIMLSVNKAQNLYKELKGTVQEITNQEELRKSLNSPNTILFRTEIDERLFVDGRAVEGQRFKDFTYEFLGKDAWPERDRFKQWHKLLFDNLPLHVYYTNNVEKDSIYTNIDDERFQISKHLVSSVLEVPSDGVNVFLDKEFNRDIFELFFLLDPNTSLASEDNKIQMINTGPVITIPEHYLNEF